MLATWIFPNASAQQSKIDSLENSLTTYGKEDTKKVSLLLTLGLEYMARDPSKSLQYCRDAAALSVRLRHTVGQARALMGIGYYHFKHDNFGAAEETLRTAMELGQVIRDTLIIAKAVNFLGNLYCEKGAYQQAIPFFTRFLELALVLGDNKLLASAYQNNGSAYFHIGEQTRAVKEWQQALHLYEKIDDANGRAACLMGIANALGKEMPDKAMEYYQASMSTFKKLGNKENAVLCAWNLGVCLTRLSRYTEAIGILEEGLQDALGMHQARLISGVSFALAGAYQGIGDTEKALHFCRETLSLAEQRQDHGLAALASVKMAVLLGSGGVDKRTMEYALRAVTHSEVSSDMSTLVEACRLLSHEYECMRDYENAHKYYRWSSEIRDSLRDTRNMETIAEITAKYDSEQKDNQIQLLEKDKALQDVTLKRRQDELTRQSLLAIQQRQQMQLLEREHHIQHLEMGKAKVELEKRTVENEKNRKDVELLSKDRELQASVIDREMLYRNAMIVGLILVLAISFLFFRRLAGRKREIALRAEAAEYKARAAEANAFSLRAEAERKEKEAQKHFTTQLIESQELERKRVSSELHDSISQDLTVIKNRAINAVKENVPSERMRVHVQEIIEMATVALGDVRQISRALRPYQIDQIGLTETLRQTAKNAAEASALRFTIEIDTIDDMLPEAAEINLYRFVQEALNNILKHSNATSATVRISPTADTIRATIIDNGKGFDAKGLLESSSSPGLGLRTMTERVQMLGGKLHINSSPGGGTAIEVTIPAGVGVAASSQP
jgi:signal transduction histidine kinase/tetratricopeptide (TPR) repeat protein